MTDFELAALATAFKNVVAEQAVELRAQIASLRADLDTEKVKSAEFRLFESQSRQRMYGQIANVIGDAVAPRLRDIQQRTAALEQRAMPTEAAQ